MSVEFDGTNDYIYFGEILDNQTIRSVSAWVYLDTIPPYSPGTDVHNIVYHTGAGWYLAVVPQLAGDAYGRLQFAQGFDPGTVVAGWADSILQIGNWYQVGFTYNGGNTTNLPILYINGNVATTSTSNTATGSMGDDSDGYFWVGAFKSGATVYDPFDGKIKDVRVYNRILTASEMATLGTATNINKHVVQNGLIFWCPLEGTSGVTTFEGLSLTTGYGMLDIIGETEGVPYGSPVGRTTIDMWGGAGLDGFSAAVATVAQRLFIDDNGINTATRYKAGSDTDAAEVSKDYIQFPRLSEAERDALAAPANGMVVWNTNDTQLQVFYDCDWHSLTASTGAV